MNEIEVYRKSCRQARRLLYIARDVLVMYIDMVHDEDGANEMHVKRVGDAVKKLDTTIERQK